MPGGGIHLRSTHALEQELQRELNQPRVVKLTANEPKARVICFEQWDVVAAGRVGRAELHAVERVEKLGPKLQAKFILRAEVRRLEQSEVPVIDSGTSQCRIYA